MAAVKFDAPTIVRRLGALPAPARVVFAACCAERLLPAYERFSRKTKCGDYPKLRAVLTALWEDLAGKKLSARHLRSAFDACVELVPDADEAPWAEEMAAAEDAAEATAYAVQCRLKGTGQDAALSARRVYDAVDQFVTRDDSVDVNAPGAEDQILAHPVIQAELVRQLRDLDELNLRRSDLPKAVDVFRRRARREAKSLFGARRT